MHHVDVIHLESGKRVSCILPVCTIGNPVRFDLLEEISTNYSLPILIDAAGALGIEYQGKKLNLKDTEKESSDMLGGSATFQLEANSS